MVFLVISVMRLLLWGSRSLVLENAALRHQLAVLQQSAGRPRMKPSDRRFWAPVPTENSVGPISRRSWDSAHPVQIVAN